MPEPIETAIAAWYGAHTALRESYMALNTETELFVSRATGYRLSPIEYELAKANLKKLYVRTKGMSIDAKLAFEHWARLDDERQAAHYATTSSEDKA